MIILSRSCAEIALALAPPVNWAVAVPTNSVARSKLSSARIPKFAILEVDLIAVKGKTEPETIYALLGNEESAAGAQFQEFRKLWSTMLYCYRSRDWEGALEALELCRSAERNFGLTTLFDLYETRIRTFRESAPPAEWTGIFVAETK